jgi:hypothetical protein
MAAAQNIRKMGLKNKRKERWEKEEIWKERWNCKQVRNERKQAREWRKDARRSRRKLSCSN